MKKMKRGIQTYYDYSLYYLTARECFFHVWLPFPHRFSPDRADLLATSYSQFSFCDFLFSSSKLITFSQKLITTRFAWPWWIDLDLQEPVRKEEAVCVIRASPWLVAACHQWGSVDAGCPLENTRYLIGFSVWFTLLRPCGHNITAEREDRKPFFWLFRIENCWAGERRSLRH